MSYVAAQRARELGIRAALGSTGLRTLGLVVKRGAVLVAAGIGLGLIASYMLSSLLRSVLHGISPLDAPTWAVATATIAIAGLAAVLAPSLRASRVDPLIAIGME